MELILILAGYLLGCFSTGYYLVRLRTGQDIRQLGSGSTGGTNVGRLLGTPGIALTLIGDLLKGALALSGALHLGFTPGHLVFVMLAVVTGHIFPIQLGFHGGKGLATALGASLVFDYRLPVVVGAVAGLLWLWSRQLTLSLLSVVAAAPVIAAFMGHTLTATVGLALTALLILIAHRTNIRIACEQIRRQPHTSK
jgi:glycerol-3-phosphate acyltransferase PlsY